jgi:hypothetical protein
MIFVMDFLVLVSLVSILRSAALVVPNLANVTSLFKFEKVPSGFIFNDTEWVTGGYLQLSIYSYRISVTFPTGHCLFNDFTELGAYMVVFAKLVDPERVQVLIQGFSDIHCQRKEGEALQSVTAPYSPSQPTSVAIVRYELKRPPHHWEGVTFRRYHKPNCAGAHVDHFAVDGTCTSGQFYPQGFRAVVSDCRRNMLYSSFQRCEEEVSSTFATYLLTDLGLNQCIDNVNKQGNFENSYMLICGGPRMWDYRTAAPTVSPTQLLLLLMRI